MVRMLSVFRILPPMAAVIVLGAIGAALSMRLKALRFLVVLAVSVSYFAAWWLTQPAVPVEAVSNPSPWDLAMASLEVFSPFLTPAIGSGIALAIEKQKRDEPVEEEITEESLLAEKLPDPQPRDLYYDLTDSE